MGEGAPWLEPPADAKGGASGFLTSLPTVEQRGRSRVQSGPERAPMGAFHSSLEDSQGGWQRGVTTSNLGHLKRGHSPSHSSQGLGVRAGVLGRAGQPGSVPLGCRQSHAPGVF